MINKALKFIKQEYKYIIFLIVMTFFFLFPLPFYILAGGGTIKINNKITIDNEYDSKGSFNFAYVRELRATSFTYLLSFVVPDFDLLKENDVKEENETNDDYEERETIYLYSSVTSATKVAYEKAGKAIKTKDTVNYIVYVDKYAKTDLKVGDIIIEADNQKVSNVSDYRKIVATKNVGDKIKIKVKRKDKIKDCFIEVILNNENKLTGIYVVEKKEYETIPKITLKFKESESGPSGGLMLALTIYNKLIPKDITYGLKIVGTGTISDDGNVGEIGGVKYKLKGAISSHADVFIVPTGDNYEEAKKLVLDNNYKITLIEAKTFEQVLDSLDKLSKNNR